MLLNCRQNRSHYGSVQPQFIHLIKISIKTSLATLPISVYFSAGNAQHLLDISVNLKGSLSNCPQTKVAGFSKQNLVSDRSAHSFSSMKFSKYISVRQHLTNFFLK